MKISFITLLVALFACSVSAYISNVQYTAKAFLSAKYVDPESASDNNGFALFKYNAKTRTLNFHVTSSLSSVGHVSINGPISCYNRQTGGYFPQDSKECASNTGELVAKLGRGVAPDPKLAEDEEDLGFQVFKGDVVLSLLEEGMLFRNELNVQINTVTIDPETNKLSKETPGVRGQIYMSDFDSNTLEASLIFENNRGEFEDQAKIKTANSGFGFVRHNPEANNDNNKRLQVYIISSASQPGNYILKCPTGIKIIGAGDNPLNTNVDFDDNQVPLLLDLFLSKSCYIYITTAAAPDGDIFSYFSPSAHFITTSLGSNEDPKVSSPYLAFSMANFDAADKTLDILTKHNITSNITSAHVEAKDGTVYCNLTTNQAALPIRSFCRLNASYIEDLEDGKLFINIKTEANPLGELRGPLTLTIKSSSLMRSSSGSSGSTAVGLGVGLGVGIPLFILAGAAIFFLVKKGTIKF